MAGPNGDDPPSIHKGHEGKDDSDSEGEGAEEILEESPCKRWSKRREEVKQRDVPGIDCAYLAMDNETGNEVVWNEVLFSERKMFKLQEAKINSIFDNLTNLVHPNLVKFHKYWTDTKADKPRIVFITEYMSSGSMFLFLQRTRKSGSFVSVKAWKKWTTQILSALHYLHSSSPPIIHGNLSSNTVFIQQNGLIKIGSVAPDAINHHVKTCRDMKSFFYTPPEFLVNESKETGTEPTVHLLTTATDVYAFGVCALEIATTGGLTTNGEISGGAIEKAIESIEDECQRDLIVSCLKANPEERPSARQLLFHRALFEVHSLKLLAAHAIVDCKKYEDFSESIFRVADTEKVVATSKLKEMAPCQVAAFQVDLEKFLDDVKNGIYPLTAFGPLVQPPKSFHSEASSSQHHEEASIETDNKASVTCSQERSPTPTVGVNAESTNSVEPRTILTMRASMEGNQLTLILQLDDCMNRQLTTEVLDEDTGRSLVTNLILNGFICEQDADKLEDLISDVLSQRACCCPSIAAVLSPSSPSPHSPHCLPPPSAPPPTPSPSLPPSLPSQ